MLLYSHKIILVFMTFQLDYMTRRSIVCMRLVHVCEADKDMLNSGADLQRSS